ncbi:MAG: glycosyltransferase family A protein [Pseudomonadota bacterium]
MERPCRATPPTDRTRQGDRKTEPLVSVLISNYNGARFLGAALESVLAQSHRVLDVIVVDDASTDGSRALLQEMAATDPRLTPIATSRNAGPAAARNVAIDAARGDWLAIVDADDLIHPERIARLLSAARATGADLIADDLVQFGDPATAGQTLLTSHKVRGAPRIGADDLLRSDVAGMGPASLGYLKPLIRRDALAALRYDESLRIGEDFDLYLRLLLRGTKFHVVPDPTYLYRRHPGSISHRLSVAALETLLQAHDRAARTACPQAEAVRAALSSRRDRLSRALRYERLVAAIKARQRGRAFATLLRDPSLAAELYASLRDRRERTGRSRMSDTDSNSPIVLAAPDRLPGIKAPDGAKRIAANRLPPPAAPETTAPNRLACRLAQLGTRGSVDVIADGKDGLQALGFLPQWRSAHLTLGAEAAEGVVLPKGVTLTVAPQPG